MHSERFYLTISLKRVAVALLLASLTGNTPADAAPLYYERTQPKLYTIQAKELPQDQWPTPRLNKYIEGVLLFTIEQLVFRSNRKLALLPNMRDFDLGDVIIQETLPRMHLDDDRKAQLAADTRIINVTRANSVSDDVGHYFVQTTDIDKSDPEPYAILQNTINQQTLKTMLNDFPTIWPQKSRQIELQRDTQNYYHKMVPDGGFGPRVKFNSWVRE